MASSYDRIFENFTTTPEWRQVSALFVEHLKNAGVTKYQFSPYWDSDEDDFKINTNFELVYPAISGVMERVSVTRGSRDVLDANSGFEFPRSFICDVLTAPVLRKLFGRDGHPTYNCKQTKAHDKWLEFARARLMRDHDVEIRAFLARCRSQAQEMVAQEQFEADKQRFYDVQVINKIREAIQGFYRKVRPDVIREALDNVVMHDIMET